MRQRSVWPRRKRPWNPLPWSSLTTQCANFSPQCPLRGRRRRCPLHLYVIPSAEEYEHVTPFLFEQRTLGPCPFGDLRGQDGIFLRPTRALRRFNVHGCIRVENNRIYPNNSKKRRDNKCTQIAKAIKLKESKTSGAKSDVLRRTTFKELRLFSRFLKIILWFFFNLQKIRLKCGANIS